MGGFRKKLRAALVLAYLFPTTAPLTAEQVLRVQRIRLARYFGVLPIHIDAAPYADMADALAVMAADAHIAEIAARQSARR